jgi:hypothetical protein
LPDALALPFISSTFNLFALLFSLDLLFELIEVELALHYAGLLN